MGFEIEVKNGKKTDFEAVGIAGEFDFRDGKIEPLYVFIGTTSEVRDWLSQFGGVDIAEYVRYDKYAELFERVHELEEVNEKLRFKLADKVSEIKKLYNKIKELNERIEELELELAGKDIPVC